MPKRVCRRMIQTCVLFVICGIFPQMSETSGNNFVKLAEITWNRPYQKDGNAYFPGAVRTGNGGFPLVWKVGDRICRLLFFDDSSGGEIPGRAENLYLLGRGTNTAVIFQERLPLLNSAQFSTLSRVAVVTVKNLFEPLPFKFRLNEKSVPDSPQSLHWDVAFPKNHCLYIPGTAKASWGVFNFAIQMGPGNQRQLVTIPAGGDKRENPAAEKLFLFPDDQTGTSTIFQEQITRGTDCGLPVLQPKVTVQTADFNEWQKRLNQ